GFWTALNIVTHDATAPCLVHTENYFLGSLNFDASANTFVNRTNASCTGTKGLDPSEATGALNWNTALYGLGAYLMGPTNTQTTSDGTVPGAQVLYQYVDGKLTSGHLWPFPMEDRVWNETAVYTRQQQSV